MADKSGSNGAVRTIGITSAWRVEIPVLVKRSARYLLAQRGFTILLLVLWLAAIRLLTFAVSENHYLQGARKKISLCCFFHMNSLFPDLQALQAFRLYA